MVPKRPQGNVTKEQTCTGQGSLCGYILSANIDIVRCTGVRLTLCKSHCKDHCRFCDFFSFFLPHDPYVLFLSVCHSRIKDLANWTQWMNRNVIPANGTSEMRFNFLLLVLEELYTLKHFSVTFFGSFCSLFSLFLRDLLVFLLLLFFFFVLFFWGFAF